jgi:predicted SnoaL-like aldol condensation-catalyzing enzyme
MKTTNVVVLLLVGFFIGMFVEKQMISSRLEANKRLVLDFYDRSFNQKDLTAADMYLDENYIQHNPTVATSRKGFVEGIGALLKQYPNIKMTPKHVFAEDGYVITHVWMQMNSADPKDKGLAVVDLFRVKNGKVAEHWDVIQPVPAKAANDNGMF